MHPRDFFVQRKGFTLIELLVVIAIIAILAVVVVLTLNPAQLLAQSRDASRVSDMATLNTAIGLYQTDTGGTGSTGSSSIVYTSLSDTSSTCGNLGLPALPGGYIYNCTTATTTRNTNNSGWIPINFQNISAGSPLGSLPIDPANQQSTGFYYIYNTSSSQFEVTALPESQKQKAALGAKPSIPNYPDVIANGSSLTINPLFNPQGLVGYWNFDEGSGLSTQDLSGNGNLGTWAGTPAGVNSTYYNAGKVGQWAGAFDGLSTYTGIPTPSSALSINGPITIAAWIYPKTSSNYQAIVVQGNVSGARPYSFFLSPATNLAYVSLGGNIALPGNINVNPSWTINVWNYVVMTADGTNIRVYINGALAGSATNSVLATPSSTPVYIGRDVASSNYTINGSLDDVRIYNRALSAAEIQAIYNAEK